MQVPLTTKASQYLEHDVKDASGQLTGRLYRRSRRQRDLY
jgi:hypothetical protein